MAKRKVPKRTAGARKRRKTPLAKQPAGYAAARQLIYQDLLEAVLRKLKEQSYETFNLPEPTLAAAPGLIAADPIEAIAQPVPEQSGALAELSALSTRVSEVSPASLADLKRIPATVGMQMDPRLQLAMVNRQTGKQSAALASVASDEVAVVARVTDPAQWAELPGVFPGSVLGKTQDGSTIVTGRVPIDGIEAIRAADTVISLKASQPVRPVLDATTRSLQVRPDALPNHVQPDGGAGVVIGIVDTGCDFAHGNFLDANGNTRLLALWNQSGVAQTDSPFGYGRLHSRAAIDAALKAPMPYTTLGYGPQPDTPLDKGRHGTHVMDIAAGNGKGSGVPGVAPRADLIFVEVAASDIVWDGPQAVGEFFGDSVQMLEALRYIFDTAGERPCVVNLSLGTNGGPHDGTSLLEQGMDALIAERPNRAIVIAAGNSQCHGIHTSGTVAPAQDKDLVWRLSKKGGEFELWYAGDARLSCTLIGPDGTIIATVPPGENQSFGPDGHVAIFISSRLDDPNNHSNVIGVWLAPGLPAGDWTLRFRALGTHSVDYHAWVERLDQAQSSLLDAVPSHTLGSISTGHRTIVVGSYDAHKSSLPVSGFSSAGPTRDGRNKPELSAPGENVIAARSLTGTGVVRKSGTSMAAPAVTGLIALIFSEARRQGQTLTIDQLRQRLIAGCDRVGTEPWHPQFGFGRATSRSI